ncbi:hypothetical protein BCR36DRAFT_374163 [Piromyces finnis]|uniref:Uncharacterized protein n=1 Tax=Piromyces finnis TaxID=1754191 RepID=A0A1Y1UXI5_9FUNG|nr:hypothetical protein BCR36DRAFT_374163 [Piromyces finnis]|eukprot:ORX42972.1 hypothetical protein BCR36DRAFT_374163 [Piromyces finnis]
MFNTYKNQIILIIFEIFLILKIINCRNITITSTNKIYQFIHNILNNDEKENINLLFSEPYYDLSFASVTEFNINIDVSFIGNEGNRTVIEFGEHNAASLLNFRFISTKNITLKFKNLIIKNYTTRKTYSLFNIIKNKEEYNYQLVFENCVFENNESILTVNTFCGKEKREKYVKFNNCEFM